MNGNIDWWKDGPMELWKICSARLLEFCEFGNNGMTEWWNDEFWNNDMIEFIIMEWCNKRMLEWPIMELLNNGMM